MGTASTFVRTREARGSGEEGLLEHLLHELPDVWLLGSPSPSNVEHLDVVVLNEFEQVSSKLVAQARVDVQAWLPMLLGKEEGPLGASTEPVRKGKDDCPIRIPHVPFSSLEVVGRGSFCQQVLGRDLPVLGLPELWTPPAMGDVVPDSPVQSHAISTGLASGDDFLNHLKRLSTLGRKRSFVIVLTCHAVLV